MSCSLIVSTNGVAIVFFTTIIFAVNVKAAFENHPHDSINFTHETCNLETCSEFKFLAFFTAESYIQPNGILQIYVKFRGVADGFMALSSSTNPNDTDNSPLYMILLGGYNNMKSEIRRAKNGQIKQAQSTPGIMSPMLFRSFLIRYDESTGGLWVFSEGSDLPVLHWKDSNPLPVKFFSFATYHNRIIQVAYNCTPLDTHSSVPSVKKGNFYDFYGPYQQFKLHGKFSK